MTNRGAHYWYRSQDSSWKDACCRCFPSFFPKYLFSPINLKKNLFSSHSAHHSLSRGFYRALWPLPRSVWPEVPLCGSTVWGHNPGESVCSAEPWSGPGYHAASLRGTGEVREMYGVNCDVMRIRFLRAIQIIKSGQKWEYKLTSHVVEKLI